MKNIVKNVMPSGKKASKSDEKEPESIMDSPSGLTSSIPLSPDHETQLFHNFLAGDDAAYRTLYDAFERSLYIYCVRILKNESEARDIFQDIWVRMYKMRGEKIEVRRFSGLLFTVARNYCLNSLRDNKAYASISFDELPDEAEVIVRTKDIENADLRELLQRALSQLPFNQRESFILREYVGYSYDEIADIMGTNAANVRARAHRARERLRTIISAWLELKNGEKEL